MKGRLRGGNWDWVGLGKGREGKGGHATPPVSRAPLRPTFIALCLLSGLFQVPRSLYSLRLIFTLFQRRYFSTMHVPMRLTQRKTTSAVRQSGPLSVHHIRGQTGDEELGTGEWGWGQAGFYEAGRMSREGSRSWGLGWVGARWGWAGAAGTKSPY